MVAPTLSIEQYQFRDDGLVLNASPQMPFVDLNTVQGIDSAPTRQTTKDQEGIDGGTIESAYESLRTVVLTGTAYALPTALDAYMDQLKANFEPNSNYMPLYWQSDNGARVVYGKSQGLKFDKTSSRGYGQQEFNVTIICGDSRIYSPDVSTTGPVYLGSGTSAGRAFPKAYTYGYGTPVVQSSGTITPGGNRNTPGLYTITGPITNPIIVNDTLGMQWAFQITIPAGETLIINPRIKTVRLGSNGVSRRNTMTGLWWLLNPTQNAFRLIGSGGTAGVTNLTVTAQSAWR